MHVFMLKKYTYILSPLLLSLLIMSCHSDVGEVNPAIEQTNQITVPLNFEEVDGNLVGYILDNENNPVAGAQVSIYSGETISNEFGVFAFENTKVDLQGTFIKVEKEGYLIGSDMVYPNSNGNGTSRIKMLKIINETSFEASEGGIVNIQGGGTITFSPSSLIRSNGSIYDGKVSSTAYMVSPTDPELGVLMAGGLLGLDQKGRHRVLSTYGMLAVELRGFDNQILRLKSDKIADLSFPIDDSLQGTVESDVPGWSFNFQDGLWHESAITTNDNQNFKTSINSLGFWNLALPNAVSQVCGRLIYTNDLPAKSYVVQIINNGLPSRIGITDQDGYFCGKVPFGENLKFQVLHPICKNVLKEMAIGQFEEVGTIGDVIIDVDEEYITGAIECGGDEISNATIIIESGDYTSIHYPNSNGLFSINLDEILCSSSTYSLFAYNNTTQMMSEVVELTANSAEILNLEVCQVDCTLGAVFEFEKEDYCLDGDYSRVSIQVAGGSGDYGYAWQDGSTDIFMNNPASGQVLCVEIIDNTTGCELTLCEEVDSYKRISIESISSANLECQKTSGFITLGLIGGNGLIEYTWTGPDGYASNEKEVENLSPGTYEIVVKDEGGCEASASVDVYDVTTPVSSAVEEYCNVTIINIEELEGYKPYTYNWEGGTPNGNQLYVYSPGFYKLTLTDANACSLIRSWEISKVGLLPVIDPTFTCEAGTVTFSNLQTEYDYFYEVFGSSDKIPVNFVLDKAELSILETGYRFKLGSENETFSDCSITESIELPRFEGLEIDFVSPVSCETCSDGSIEYNLNVDKDCIDCSIGDAIVLRSEDGADVTVMNNEKQLDKGEYYVVVLDSNSGCYIAHSLVVVE